MTTEWERFNSVKGTRGFLERIAYGKKKDNTWTEIKDDARRCLRHYPFDREVEKWEQTRTKTIDEIVEILEDEACHYITNGLTDDRSCKLCVVLEDVIEKIKQLRDKE